VGNLQLDANLRVAGTITVDTFNVKNLVTENGSLASVGEWAYNTEAELNGKGFTWTWGDGSAQLMYRTGNRLWTNANLDLDQTASFSIGDVAVLSANTLGSTIVNSNLRSVGTLNKLKVSGDAEVGEFAFFNSTYNRLGIGIEEPNAAISIIENNVEIGIGSPANGLATIGTYSNHDLGIVTDNIARITVKNGGEVQIGDIASKTGVLRIYGTLFADSIQTDSRIDRTHPLQFNATAETSIYGLGLVWSGTDVPRQLIMQAGPDRLWSSESVDLAAEKSYSIDKRVVLSENSLGIGVVHSGLVTVGTLQELTVQGAATFLSGMSVDIINANALVLNDGEKSITASNTGFNASNSITISVAEKRAIYADANQISIGDSSSQSKPVKVFGKLAVGINNPDPSVNFSVNGDVSIGNKRFTNATEIPFTGIFQVGDICWNTAPQANSYIGWVCIVAGEPGQWLPFGAISPQ
jgi:hypothetical protein